MSSSSLPVDICSTAVTWMIYHQLDPAETTFVEEEPGRSRLLDREWSFQPHLPHCHSTLHPDYTLPIKEGDIPFNLATWNQLFAEPMTTSTDSQSSTHVTVTPSQSIGYRQFSTTLLSSGKAQTTHQQPIYFLPTSFLPTSSRFTIDYLSPYLHALNDIYQYICQLDHLQKLGKDVKREDLPASYEEDEDEENDDDSKASSSSRTTTTTTTTLDDSENVVLYYRAKLVWELVRDGFQPDKLSVEELIQTKEEKEQQKKQATSTEADAAASTSTSTSSSSTALSFLPLSTSTCTLAFPSISNASEHGLCALLQRMHVSHSAQKDHTQTFAQSWLPSFDGQTYVDPVFLESIFATRPAQRTDKSKEPNSHEIIAASIMTLLQVRIAHLLRLDSLDVRTWPLDSTSTDKQLISVDTWKSTLSTVTESIKAFLYKPLAHRIALLQLCLRCSRELCPASSFFSLLISSAQLDLTATHFQRALFNVVARDELSQRFPPDCNFASEYWSVLCNYWEQLNVEILEEILFLKARLLLEVIKQKERRDVCPLPSHFTLTYQEEVEEEEKEKQTLVKKEVTRTCTLRMETGFSSTTGLSLWPAAFLMAEWMISHKYLFPGKRGVELGTGIGLTSIVLHRCGISSLVCTDCDPKVLHNLHINFRINRLPLRTSSESSTTPTVCDGIHVEKLDWTDYKSEQISKYDPDYVFAADTIYLPEFHDAQSAVVHSFLAHRYNKIKQYRQDHAQVQQDVKQVTDLVARCGISTCEPLHPVSTLSKTADEPLECVAYYAQVNRNNTTFEHFLSMFKSKGLIMEEIPLPHIPQRFAYERSGIFLYKITLDVEKYEATKQ